MAPFDIGSLKIRLDTENKPLVPLPVVANLAATNESVWIRIKGLRRKSLEGCGVRERIEMSIGASPAVTGVATEVEAGPRIIIALWLTSIQFIYVAVPGFRAVPYGCGGACLTRFTRGTKKRTFIAERPLKLKSARAG